MAKRNRDELNPFEREKLSDIQAMFRALKGSYERLEDKTDIDKNLIQFDGFDGNDPYESKFMRHSGFVNSHGQRMPYYERLLQEWRRSPDKDHLTRKDIVRILQ